jgi:hypothetical protein
MRSRLKGMICPAGASRTTRMPAAARGIYARFLDRKRLHGNPAGLACIKDSQFAANSLARLIRQINNLAHIRLRKATS